MPDLPRRPASGLTDPAPPAAAGVRHVLVVDPEPGFRGILREQLEAEGGWRVSEAAALAAPEAVSPPPDLVLASAGDRAGRAAVARWRAAGMAAPIVALVPARARPVPAASLTLHKPLRLGELLTAIRGLLPGPGSAGAAAARRIGPWHFDPAAKRLTGGEAGRVVRLTEKEAAMLELLWAAAGAVVSREDLLARVWGWQEGVSTHTVETHVYRLRRKIEPRPGAAALLVSEAGGYRLVR